MKPILALLASLPMLALAAQSAPADVFLLSGGGQIVGELVNRDETPRQKFVIQTADGATVTLDASQVKQAPRLRAEEAEYERIRPTYADTAAAQSELAQWCHDHRLTAQRETHLRRVIELDPDNADARRFLGYSKVDGQWVMRSELMTQRGYRWYKGRWVLPQEIEALESKRNLETAQQEWFQKVKRWRGWLGGERDQQARENLRAITDPMAVKALAMALHDDADVRARLLCVDALAKIDAPTAAGALAIAAIDDQAEEVRMACLDRLETKKDPEVVGYFVKKLKDKKSDNETINLAGIALGRMKDPSAVGPLIDALVTTHKIKVPKAGGDGATSGSFSKGPGGRPGPSGMTAGGGPTFIYKSMSNQSVLDALVAITGQNFDFNQEHWKHWYAAQRKPAEMIDARRNG
jgi:hypothetical protein